MVVVGVSRNPGAFFGWAGCHGVPEMGRCRTMEAQKGIHGVWGLWSSAGVDKASGWV